MPKSKKQNKFGFTTRLVGYIRRFNFVGLVLALIFFCVSLLPSLLPRPWLYQGLISGVNVLIGYGIGTLLSKAWRWLGLWEPSKNIKTISWRLFGVLAPVAAVALLFIGASWQNEVRELLGEQPESGRHMFRIFVLTTVVFILLLSLARGIRKLNHFLRKITEKWFPRRAAFGLSVLVVSVLLYWLISGVLLQTFVDVSNSVYANKNNTTPAGVTQPTSKYRSGSPESLVAWDTIGYQGQSFVSRGPSQQQLKEFTGGESKEQIRIYAGINSADDAKSRADLAVKELERTGAFSRKVLIVATATGTGWLEPQSVDSIEYMYGGDSAIVSQQYSYLPSWISFLVDKQNATEAGQALFNAVYSKWASLPADQRPKLIPYGLSLGSFGGQAAFGGASQLQFLSDGALYMGTPSDTSLWKNITVNRDAGSPEWQPLYENGKYIRFAASNTDITKSLDSWQKPRTLYMQHASDPVVWFSFDLLFNEPDWLKEKRGPDVSPKTHWYPFVTFFQVTVDQFFGVSVPNGHGHNYGNTIVNAWAAIVAPDGWNEDKSAMLQKIIDSYTNE